MSSEPPSLRTFLAEMAACDQVVTITDPVTPEFEIASYLVHLDPGPVVRFDHVEHPGAVVQAVVGNVLGSLDRVAAAMGVPRDRIQTALLEAIAAPGALHEVTDAPVQERSGPLDWADLPVPTFFEREQGPYLTAGVIIARDPITGRGNASFARVRPLPDGRALVGIAPNHHLNQMARRAPDGRLPIAVVLGAHPAVQLAACLYLGLGQDELTYASPLLGQPLRVTRCSTVDLLVPADAEIVLEGVLDVTATVVEGEVSEYHGMYEDYGPAATAELSTWTSRADPLLQVILPGWHREHAYLGAVPIAAGLRAAVARTVPTVGEIAVTEAGSGRLAAAVQVADPRPGQAKQVMAACWGTLSMLKQVTVVDTDIDVWDPIAVEWARISRCRIDRDLVLLPDARTDRSEPLESGGTVTKVGYDALARPGDRVEGWERARPPAHVVAEVGRRLARTTADRNGDRR
ncbi:UbiD family decarboxylase [Nakamurella leprariae]|uniref:UbiD family decarboxylase n=1 Tax=Nakamurella leprariae TaxID=2803911 RepID=A0A938YCC9_9ACTN|nr:UbiD family decarboxylase [Nakamurella leprariae]MBM9467001.1 UbiD family decarboxylase [Nakamurella leprariae]